MLQSRAGTVPIEPHKGQRSLEHDIISRVVCLGLIDFQELPDISHVFTRGRQQAIRLIEERARQLPQPALRHQLLNRLDVHAGFLSIPSRATGLRRRGIVARDSGKPARGRTGFDKTSMRNESLRAILSRSSLSVKIV